jgi:hypothetical protein
VANGIVMIPGCEAYIGIIWKGFFEMGLGESGE